ncbi:MAG: mechanosensitive ion channel family protein, partial [Sedimenticolaceae bacterium]
KADHPGGRGRDGAGLCDPVIPGARPESFTSGLVVLLLLVLFAGPAVAKNPLLPIDTSSPRATMQSFLALTEAAADRYQVYRDSPSRTSQQALEQIDNKVERLFDLSETAPANRKQVASDTFYLLWDVIARQRLPKLADIPDGSAEQTAPDAPEPLTRWRIPHTEISIVRIAEGPYAGEYRFSAGTVKNARRFYEMAREIPYVSQVHIKDVHRINELITGWMIPMTWVESLPEWANYPLSGQVLWKWLAILVLLGLALGILLVVYRWSHKKDLSGSFGSYLRYMSAPLTLLTLLPLIDYFARGQVYLTGTGADLLQSLAFLSYGITLVWVVWLTANQVAEMIIASPHIKAESLDASLLRLVARTVGVVAALVLLFKMLDQMGVPVAGLVTGAGVGGIAIALAAKSTLENFMGALNLFADRPVRVGDLCRYDDDVTPGWRPIGRIESIGLRSTKVRHLDRSLITIPNADFAQLKIVNFNGCDRMLLTATLGLRYETTDDQLRFLLANLRELLHAHPKVIHTADDPVRVRFVGFGDFSLNVAIRVYIRTQTRNEFLAIQEDILLRAKKLVEQAGTGFAFPSSTVYLGRDGGLDQERQQAAEKQVREWASAHALPFPDLAEDYRRSITDTLDYPPVGSPGADTG